MPRRRGAFFPCLRPARVLLFACALIWPLTGVSAEQRGAGRIDVEVPEPLRKLLTDHLAVAKVAADPDEGVRLAVVRATVRLSVKLDSGGPVTLSPLEGHGLERYDNALVERFRRFAPRDRYTQTRLLKFQRSLQNTPYVAFVLVDTDADAREADRVPLTGVRCAGAQTPLRPCG